MPEIISYSVVPSARAADAFKFHYEIATTNDHIWPRTEENIRAFAASNQLFGAQRHQRDFVGLCYVTLDRNDWELGGLIVDPEARAKGIGTTLVRLAIAHTMVYSQPWQNGQHVVAYVHQANEEPRKLLTRLGFSYVASFEVPDEHAPASMKRNEQGKIVGDKFRFTQEGLKHLSQWFGKESHESFDERVATVDLGPVTIDDLRDALRDLASRYP